RSLCTTTTYYFSLRQSPMRTQESVLACNCRHLDLNQETLNGKPRYTNYCLGRVLGGTLHCLDSLGDDTELSGMQGVDRASNNVLPATTCSLQRNLNIAHHGTCLLS